MSSFLDELDSLELSDDSDNYQSLEKIINFTKKLGKNARRMFEIGIVQDELQKLEFELESSPSLETYRINTMYPETSFNGVYFYADFALFDSERYYYKLPTWQQDLLTRVKELINHA